MKKILMYHSIDGNGNGNSNGEVGSRLYSVSRENFEKQMEYIKGLKNPHVIITFDDGDVTNYKYAYPVLKELGPCAYFFIIVSKVGTRGYMNWEEIKELFSRVQEDLILDDVYIPLKAVQKGRRAIFEPRQRFTTGW